MPVSVFERMYEIAGHAVKRQRSAGAVIKRRVAQCGGRDGLISGIIGQWNAEPVAQGRANESQAGPAARTQRVMRIDRIMARQANRRQRQVGQVAQAGAGQAAQPAHTCRRVETQDNHP